MQGAQGEKGCRVRSVLGAVQGVEGIENRDMQLHCRLDNDTADDMRPTSFDSESVTARVA